MKNILILTYWSYPDALIQTYTLPYVRIIRKNLPPGNSIYLLTLEKDQSVLEKPKRTKIAERLEQEGVCWIPYAYKPFGSIALMRWIGISLHLLWLIVSRRIATIHCWCTPPGAIGYFLSLVLKRKLILDSYEPHAEAMVENGTWRSNSVAFRLLFWLEKKQTQRASYIISATEGMRTYAASKYNVDVQNFFVKPACVDFSLFNFEQPPNELMRLKWGLENRIVCIYAGKLGGIYLENEVFDFIKVAIEHWGEAFCFLMLTNHSNAEIDNYCTLAKVKRSQVVSMFVPHEEVAEYMKLADFALTPVKPVPTKRYCTPIKDGEYWALGLPVVIPANISDDSDIIEMNKIGAVLKSLDVSAYRNAIIEIERLIKRDEVKKEIHNVALRYRDFKIAENVYSKVYSLF